MLKEFIQSNAKRRGDEATESCQGDVDAHVHGGRRDRGEIMVSEIPSEYASTESNSSDCCGDPKSWHPARCEGDDEDDARDRVKDLMDGSYMDPLHYDREVTVREQGVMGAGFDPQ